MSVFCNISSVWTTKRLFISLLLVKRQMYFGHHTTSRTSAIGLDCGQIEMEQSSEIVQFVTLPGRKRMKGLRRHNQQFLPLRRHNQEHVSGKMSHLFHRNINDMLAAVD